MFPRSVGAGVCLAVLLSGCSSPTKPETAATVASVQVSGTAPAVGGSLQFTATAAFSDGSKQDVTSRASWLSSNTNVMTVTSAGLVTGVAAGTATLTATFQSVSGTAPIDVAAVTCNFTVGPPRYDLPKEGGTVTMPVTMFGAPCAWNAELGIGHSSFMTIVSGATGFGNGAIVVNMSPNVQANREGSVIVSRRFTVLFFQKQIDCVTRVTPNPVSVPSSGGSSHVVVEAPPWCTWLPQNPSRGLIVAGVSTTAGNGVFDLGFGMNGSGATRIHELTVEHLPVRVEQVQPQGGTYFGMNSDAAAFGRGQDSFSFSPPFPMLASAATTNEAVFDITANWPVPFGSATTRLILTLRAPNGQPLTPGTYTNATGIPGSASSPYLNLVGAGTPDTCRPSGFFTVREAVYGPGPSVVRFWATFEFTCEASPSQWTRGEISFGR